MALSTIRKGHSANDQTFRERNARYEVGSPPSVRCMQSSASATVNVASRAAAPRPLTSPLG
jgi:hypothetical protein